MARTKLAFVMLTGTVILASCGGGSTSITTNGGGGNAVVQPQVTPTPKKLRFLYAASLTNGSATVMARDSSGSLQIVKDVAGTVDFPCIDPSGTFLLSAATLHAYRIDPATANLTELAGSPLGPSGLTPRHCAFTPDGKFAYVSTDQNAVLAFAIDATANSILPVSGSPFQGPGNSTGTDNRIVIEPQGKFLYTSFITASGSSATGSVNGFAIAPNGALTAIAGSPFASPVLVESMAGDPLGRFLYLGNAGTQSLAVSSFVINPTTGVISHLTDGMCNVCDEEYDLAPAPNGQRLYVLAHELNTRTGTLLRLFNVGADGTLPRGQTAAAGVSQSPEGDLITEPFSHTLAMDPAGDALYLKTPIISSGGVGVSNPDQVWQYRIEANGTLTDVRHLAAGQDKGLAAAAMPQ